MKHFIKTSLIVALVWVVVVSVTLSTSSCKHRHDVTPVDTTTVVSKPDEQWSSAKDFLDWISVNNILFKVMSPEELYNVATVVATRNDHFTKKDIVREYLDHRDVYTALHVKNIGNGTINTNTKDTIIDGVKVKLISTTRYE